MIDLLLVHGRVRVLAQCCGRAKFPVTYVTLPERAVECTVGRSKPVALLEPSYLLAGEGAVSVPLAHYRVDYFAVEPLSLWTGP